MFLWLERVGSGNEHPTLDADTRSTTEVYMPTTLKEIRC